MIREEDILEAAVDAEVDLQPLQSRRPALGYAPDSWRAITPKCQDGESSGIRRNDQSEWQAVSYNDDSDVEWVEEHDRDSEDSDAIEASLITRTPPQIRKRKRLAIEEEPLSPMSKRIVQMQADLAELVQARQHRH